MFLLLEMPTINAVSSQRIFQVHIVDSRVVTRLVCHENLRSHNFFCRSTLVLSSYLSVSSQVNSSHAVFQPDRRVHFLLLQVPQNFDIHNLKLIDNREDIDCCLFI